MNTDTESEERHRALMRKHKAAVDARIAQAGIDTGVVLVITGPGKGKSSSGFGIVARTLGHGLKAGVVQFIKGAIPTGEEQFFRRFPGEVVYHVCGEGFTWETQNRARDIDRARQGWELARGLLKREDIAVLLLDEINIVLAHGYLDETTVMADIAARWPMQHVVATGRGAPPGLVAMANTVSDIKVIKHAFKQGIRAQRGIEY